jgi:hypothetical protein
MKNPRTIAPIECRSFEHALDTAKLMSHHNGLNIEPQFMYVIVSCGRHWVDSSMTTSPTERLICSVFHRHTKPVIDKIVMHYFDNGFFIKRNGRIYAIYQSRKLIANTEHVVTHFEHNRFWQLKHGNPHARWLDVFDMTNFVRDKITDYDRTLGLL